MDVATIRIYREFNMPRLSDSFLRTEKAKGAEANIFFSGVVLRIRYVAGNTAFADEVKAIPAGDKEGDRKFARAVARHILVGWTDLEDDEGNPFEPTLENRTQLLLDYEGVLAVVLEKSKDPTVFTHANKDVDEQLGN